MTPWRRETSTCLPFPDDDIDTDQIIPARYLVTTSKDGLRDALFADRRANVPLEDVRYEGAGFLLAGGNFGCGSSREHAPWALLAWGFKAVIARSFADIFRANALKCGLLPVTIPDPAWHRLVATIKVDPAATVTVDLIEETTLLPDGSCEALVVDPFSRHQLLSGEDEMDYLRACEDQIAAFEARHG